MKRTSPACASGVSSAVIFRVFYLASLLKWNMALWPYITFTICILLTNHSKDLMHLIVKPNDGAALERNIY